MKKLFTALMLFAFSASLLNAKVSYSFSTQNWRNLPAVVSTPSLAPATQPMSVQQDRSKLPGVQAAIEYTTVYDSVSGLGTGWMGSITPVAYDPISNGFYMAVNNFNQTETGSLNFSNMRVFATYDNGETWQRGDVVEYESQMKFVYPALSTGKSEQDITKANYAAMATILTPADETLYYDGLQMWLHQSDNSFFQEKTGDIDIPLAGEKQIWRTAKTTNVVTEAAQVGYFFNRTLKHRAAPSTAKDGYYAMLAYDFGGVDLPLGLSGKIPERFFSTEFSIPTNAPATATPADFLSTFEAGTDNNGNIYAACMNFFSDNSTIRVPAVSKSTDGGKTWAAWNKMPYTLVDTYVQEHNLVSLANSFNWTPYQRDAFVAYGDNQYSYFFRAITDSLVDGTATSISWAIYEAFYNGSVWGLRKVTELLLPEDSDIYSIWLGGREVQVIEPVTISEVEFDLSQANDVKLAVRLTYNEEGNELQAAKTADGQNIVLKWIDNTERLSLNGYPLHHIDTAGNNGINVQTDTKMESMFTTDVFMAYRDVSSNTWEEAKNVTRDSSFDRATYMPAIVKDLENIPLATTRAKFRYNNWPNVPDIFNDMVPYWYWEQALAHANINLLTVSVEEEEEKFGFRLSDAYPNPADEAAELGFALDVHGDVRLEIYNALGQKVALLLDQYMTPGHYGQNFDTAGLQSGVYYITLTVDGKSLTKPLNVVK